MDGHGEGYFVLPSNQYLDQFTGWLTSTDANGQIWGTSPDGRVFACYLNSAYQLVFTTAYPYFP